MPVGTLKNQLYAFAMPLLGKKPAWKAGSPISHILRGANVVGGSVCALYPDGRTETECVGEARLYPSSVPVHADTVFRTASIAKFATALLVLRLQTLGKLSVYEDISEALGYLVRNPLYQDQPITPYHLLSHTSGMTDTPAYFSSFSQPSALHTLLSDGALYAPNVPGRRLIYSNLAAGILGAWLEGKFGAPLERLAQEHLFAPLEVWATFDVTTLAQKPVADSYRVLPFRGHADFCAETRMRTMQPITQPDPERHYLLTSGNLYITSAGLVKLAAVLRDHRAANGAPFLSLADEALMKTPVVPYPEEPQRLQHGLGVLVITDPRLSPRTIYGHQGFAYGAVNGVFEDGKTVFASLNSGASERRHGHLGVLNERLLRYFLHS